jgi:hypothetical protein
MLVCIYVTWLVSQASASSELTSVQGLVVNKVTGGPVKHAHVMCMKVNDKKSTAAESSTDTDSDGHFSLHLEPGSYRLWVEQVGFVRQFYKPQSSDGPQALLTLSPGDQPLPLSLQMVPLGAIAGKLTDEDGDIVQGGSVQVLRFSYTTGRRQLTLVSGTASNDRGEYRAYGLPAGRYLLLASRSDWPPYSGLFYPGVPDASSATEISLSGGGDIAGIDVSLPKLHTVAVRGRLLSSTGDFAGSQLQVVLAHREGTDASYYGQATAAVNPSTGAFEVQNVMPGSYWLLASQLVGTRAFGGRVALDVSEAVTADNISVPLTSFELDGSVELDGVDKLTSLKIGLRSADGSMLGRQSLSAVGPAGELRLAGLTPGVWELNISSLPDTVCVKSATLNDVDLLRQDLTLSSDPRGLLRIVLSGHCAELSGTVVDDSGRWQRATVVMVPADGDLRHSPLLYRMTSTQGLGTFVLKGVRPGSYKVFALADIAPFAWLDPDLLAPVESLSEFVSVSEGDHATMMLKLISEQALSPER